MKPPSHIFKSYDIRGIYPEEINEQNAKTIAKAIYKFLQNDSKKDLSIVVARDMRISSPKISESIITTLIEKGAEVIDIDLAATPTFYFTVFHYGFDAGIIITASHNPKEYNGLKVVKRTDKGLLKIGKPTGMENIKEFALNGEETEDKENGRKTKLTGVLNDELDNAFNLLELKPEALSKFKIAADPANAMAIEYLDALFSKIPSEIHKLNFDLDGTFPAHQADPLQIETLKDLRKKVVEEKCDLGIAPDGDGDRMIFIDEKGEVVRSSSITALVAREILTEMPGSKIIVEQKYVLTPVKNVEEAGGEPILCRTGHAFITEKMTQTGAVFAGEDSGHFYYKTTGNAESQLITLLAILKILSREKKPFSEVIKSVRRSHESGEINFEVKNASDLIEKIKKDYSDGDLSEMDGASITYPNWRVSLRTSNTEPLLRLNIEGKTSEIVEEKKQELVKIIEENRK